MQYNTSFFYLLDNFRFKVVYRVFVRGKHLNATPVSRRYAITYSSKSSKIYKKWATTNKKKKNRNWNNFCTQILIFSKGHAACKLDPSLMKTNDMHITDT